MTDISLTGALLFTVVGAVLGSFLAALKNKQARDQEKAAGQDVVTDAKRQAQDIVKSAKYDAKQLQKEAKESAEHEYKSKMGQLNKQEKDLNRKEIELEQATEKAQAEEKKFVQRQEHLEEKISESEKLKEQLTAKRMEYGEKLESVAGMTTSEAKAELIAAFEQEAKVDAAQKIRAIEDEAKEEAEKKAKRIIGIAIQRFAGEYVAEQTISSVELPNDDIKGRLIGREGRNIRAFEQICGVDLIIDDTPGVVTISTFNVVRKEIAKSTIERLIADGRIHPAKIEEFYEKSKAEFEVKLKDLGEKAQMEIGVHGLHPEVLKLIGALNWRTSYMQNQYQHSLEVAFLCGAMAAELGMNVKQARRAGLLHDIGKVLDASAEGSHAVVGADFAKKYGEAPDIVHAIRAHHEDVRPESVLAHLVMAADALSGGRPGVRKFLKESYVSRLTDIENIVNSFEGVSKSYAISAGREIRVLVENERVTDEQTVMLSRDIAKKIEDEMSYPGTIKVSVIRETRAVGVAK